jgi:hypothetical protein
MRVNVRVRFRVGVRVSVRVRVRVQVQVQVKDLCTNRLLRVKNTFCGLISDDVNGEP